MTARGARGPRPGRRWPRPHASRAGRDGAEAEQSPGHRILPLEANQAGGTQLSSGPLKQLGPHASMRDSCLAVAGGAPHAFVRGSAGTRAGPRVSAARSRIKRRCGRAPRRRRGRAMRAAPVLSSRFRPYVPLRLANLRYGPLVGLVLLVGL